jgi:hypothetical protein
MKKARVIPDLSQKYFSKMISCIFSRGRVCLTLISGIIVMPDLARGCNSVHGYVLNALRDQPMAKEPFFINLVIIILVESLFIFLLLIRRCTFAKALLGSVLINIASALGISVLFLYIGNQYDPFSSWHERADWDLLGTFFSGWLDRLVPLLWILGTAVIIECPLLKLIIRRLQISWWRTMLVILLVNIVSYVSLCISEPYMMHAWYTHLAKADRRILREWQNKELLDEINGRIYSLVEKEIEQAQEPVDSYQIGLSVDRKVKTSRPHVYQLQYFNIKDGQWNGITNSPHLIPGLWSLTTNRMAYLEENNIHITTFPEMNPVSTINLTNYYSGGSLSFLLSGNGKRLAVVLLDSYLKRKISQSARRVFFRAQILVFDTGSGALIRRCSRWSLRGEVYWSPDAEKLIFTSAINTAEFERGVVEPEKIDEDDATSTRYGIPPEVQQALYSLDVETGEVKLFDKQFRPNSQSGGKLMRITRRPFRSPLLELLDITTKEYQSVAIKNLGGWNDIVQLSPDGRYLSAEFRMARNTCHAITDLKNLSRRHIISESPMILWPVCAKKIVWLTD